ncbi:MAG: hypothetical protein WBX15_18220, partial [Thermoanaerobaculia bacterium]
PPGLRPEAPQAERYDRRVRWVCTVGDPGPDERRAEAIRQRTMELIDGPALIVGTLPTATGRRRIEELQKALAMRA